MTLLTEKYGIEELINFLQACILLRCLVIIKSDEAQMKYIEQESVLRILMFNRLFKEHRDSGKINIIFFIVDSRYIITRLQNCNFGCCN